MEYNKYLFTQLVESHLKDHLDEHYYEYDSRFIFTEKLYKYFKHTDDGNADLYGDMEDFLIERKDEIKQYGIVGLNKVKKEVFLNWIFDDFSDSKGWFIDYAFDKLFAKGELHINFNDIIELTNYIPGHICEIKLDEVEYNAKEVIFI